MVPFYGVSYYDPLNIYRGLVDHIGRGLSLEFDMFQKLFKDKKKWRGNLFDTNYLQVQLILNLSEAYIQK